MKNIGYKKRLVDDKIAEYLDIFGAVQIDGPKYCGKTWSAQAFAKSEIHLDDDESLELARADKDFALVGERPRLVDEWQRLPPIRDSIRRAVDASGNVPGSFLLTGSSAPPVEAYQHSGAGRIGRIHMRPMSLFESGRSDGSVSLLGLFEGETVRKAVDVSIADVADWVCRGGWPATVDRTLRAARAVSRQYLEAVFVDNAPRAGKSPELARRMFASLARNDTKAATIATLASDCAGGEEADPSAKPARKTVDSYLAFFKSIYLIEELPGWSEGVRDKKRVRSKPKRYIVDPSLTAAQLGLSDRGLLADMQTFGTLFEGMCLRDLRVYLEARPEFEGARLSYFSDSSGCEVDAIVELPDSRWGAFEIKLSEDKVADGVSNLLAMRERMGRYGAAGIPEPSFLAVLVGRCAGARMTSEGVHVVPVSLLGA